jgi:hypothetical protein
MSTLPTPGFRLTTKSYFRIIYLFWIFISCVLIYSSLVIIDQSKEIKELQSKQQFYQESREASSNNFIIVLQEELLALREEARRKEETIQKLQEKLDQKENIIKDLVAENNELKEKLTIFDSFYNMTNIFDFFDIPDETNHQENKEKSFKNVKEQFGKSYKKAKDNAKSTLKNLKKEWSDLINTFQ